MMPRVLLLSALLLAALAIPLQRPPRGIRIGSKAFTESVVLGEMLVQSLQSNRLPAAHLAQLGGTRIVYDALLAGDIDAYPEYTGTLRQEIFAAKELASDAQLEAQLARDGLEMTSPLGFNNTYALAVRRNTAQELNLKTISDLTRHPELRYGFSNEFLDRADGWENLRQAYRFSQIEVHGMEHAIAYQQIAAKAIDVMDVYSTDGQIHQLDLQVLEDDQQFFPRYDAVIIYRTALAKQVPQAVTALRRLEGALDETTMTRLNDQATTLGDAQTAADFLRTKLHLDAAVDHESRWMRIVRRTIEHIDLVRRSLIPALFAAIPLGIAAAKFPRFGQAILGIVSVVQTIPALALLVLLIAPMAWLQLETVGAGSATALTALFLYSLLPIVRNTAAGLQGIAPEHRYSAAALGISPTYQLLKIELPLASPAILAGVKTAASLNVGFATLGALIGAGGYGQPILTGIRNNNTGLILEGALPAAFLALAFQALFELAERRLVPQGLRSKQH